MATQTNTLKEYTKGKQSVNFDIEHLGFNSPYDTSTLHRHDFYQIIVLREGTGVHIVDFEQYTLTAPCISVVFPQQTHKMVLSDDAQGDVIMFDDTIFCSEILANELREYNVDLHKKINCVRFADKVAEFDDILSIANHIWSLDGSLNEIRKMQVKFLIKIIILKSIDAASDHVFTGTKSRDFDTYLEFRRLVDLEFAKNRKVEHYCERLNVSAKKLNSVCNQYTGKTALAIIHERLSLEIKKIFILEDMSLKEIAYELDFNSQSALNKYIDAKFGCTPSELKQKVLNSYATEPLL